MLPVDVKLGKALILILGQIFRSLLLITAILCFIRGGQIESVDTISTIMDYVWTGLGIFFVLNSVRAGWEINKIQQIGE